MSRRFDFSGSVLRINEAFFQGDTASKGTMACWVKPEPTAGGESAMFVGDKDVDDQFSGLNVGSTGDVTADARFGATTGTAAATQKAPFYRWSHIAAVFRGVSDRSAFLNGMHRGNDATGILATTGYDRTSIGRRDRLNPDGNFQGQIAQAAVWDIDLDDTEIRQLAMGILPIRVRRGNLKAWWPLMAMNGKHGGAFNDELDHGPAAKHLVVPSPGTVHVGRDDPPVIHRGAPRFGWQSILPISIHPLPIVVTSEGDISGITEKRYQRCEIVRNQITRKIFKGRAVYVAGARGGLLGVGLALANSWDSMPAIGIASEDIPVNGTGRVVVWGILETPTFKYDLGDNLYVSATVPGELTATRPASPNIVQNVATVVTRSESLSSTGIGRGILHIHAMGAAAA